MSYVWRDPETSRWCIGAEVGGTPDYWSMPTDKRTPPRGPYFPAREGIEGKYKTLPSCTGRLWHPWCRCGCPNPPIEFCCEGAKKYVTLDLTGFSMTPSACAACANIAAEYRLEFDAGSQCWKYVNDSFCGVDPSGLGLTELRIELYCGVPSWFYNCPSGTRFALSVSVGCTTGRDSWEYVSDPVPTVCLDLADEEGKFTLTHCLSTYIPPVHCCEGEPPTTVKFWFPNA